MIKGHFEVGIKLSSCNHKILFKEEISNIWLVTFTNILTRENAQNV